MWTGRSSLCLPCGGRCWRLLTGMETLHWLTSSREGVFLSHVCSWPSPFHSCTWLCVQTTKCFSFNAQINLWLSTSVTWWSSSLYGCLHMVDTAYRASLRFITNGKPLTHHWKFYSGVGWSAQSLLYFYVSSYTVLAPLLAPLSFPHLFLNSTEGLFVAFCSIWPNTELGLKKRGGGFCLLWNMLNNEWN